MGGGGRREKGGWRSRWPFSHPAEKRGEEGRISKGKITEKGVRGKVEVRKNAYISTQGAPHETGSRVNICQRKEVARGKARAQKQGRGKNSLGFRNCLKGEEEEEDGKP